MTKPLILSLFRENQHAKPSETTATPPTLAVISPIGSVKGDPSKRLTTNDGTLINTNPVDPSKNEVTIKNFCKDPTLLSIRGA
jgi:hypothetical protein